MCLDSPNDEFELTTGAIGHEELYDEARFIQEILTGAGVKSVLVCCAFGVDVDHPLFAKDIAVETARLADYLRSQEEAGTFRLGITNITLTTDLEAPEFSFGNDDELYCQGEDSPLFDRVRQRWTSRYPFGMELL